MSSVRTPSEVNREAPHVSAFPFLLLFLIVIVVVVAIAIVIIATVIVTIIIRTVAAQSAGLARWRDLPQAAG